MTSIADLALQIRLCKSEAKPDVLVFFLCVRCMVGGATRRLTDFTLVFSWRGFTLYFILSWGARNWTKSHKTFTHFNTAALLRLMIRRKKILEIREQASLLFC